MPRAAAGGCSIWTAAGSLRRLISWLFAPPRWTFPLTSGTTGTRWRTGARSGLGAGGGIPGAVRRCRRLCSRPAGGVRRGGRYLAVRGSVLAGDPYADGGAVARNGPGRSAGAEAVRICSENGPVPQSAGLRSPVATRQAGGLRYIFIRRGAARGMENRSENRGAGSHARRSGGVGAASAISIRCGAEPGMENCPGNADRQPLTTAVAQVANLRHVYMGRPTGRPRTGGVRHEHLP